MEPKAASKDRFFIVIRGKSRRGFCRGCIGRVEAETGRGELTGLMYGCSSNAGSPKNGGLVRTEDAYPLTRHQAQLLLYISSPSRRLEMLCNPQLFSAICELTPGDLVVIRYKKGHVPGMVKNLMQIGKKEKSHDSFPSLSLTHLSYLSAGSTGKVVMRINSMPSTGTSRRQVTNSQSMRSVAPGRTQSEPPVPLEVGSLVEVVNNAGVTVYGVIRWLGIPEGKLETWAGVELDYEVAGCSDGVYKDQRYFTCKENCALFVPVTKCSPDSRFTPFFVCVFFPVPAYEESEEDAPPVPESEAASLFVGKMKGIQGHINSCYLDATLFRFTSSLFFSTEASAQVNYGFLCCFAPKSDPEEFISVLFQKVLSLKKILSLPQMPSCLIIQMPRCGSKYKMFSHIIPSTELDVTDLLFNSPRECFICGQMAKFECLQCLPDHKLQPGRIKQYCNTCNTQVHTHRSRCSHSPQTLAVPEGVAVNTPLPRRTMQLFGVLCIQTSHFVSFVKYGPDSHSWLFFDSMADRHGNVPEVRACPELGDFLGQPEEELTRANPALASELVRRLLCDSYMYLYHSPEMSVSKPSDGEP
uniref:ubiquitinyl hydrolase 1 n=1 Tax=Poecilia latipinna TaxID=48699 RepID=A0A3B3VWT7_9TELE